MGKGEVIFQDMEANADMSKPSARLDGFRVRVELGSAMNSMFWWYQNAARCYVYLSDVSNPNGADSKKM
jgi:hypothetical protein